MTQNWRRLIPAIGIPVIVVGSAIAVPMTAGAAPSPPERTPQEVLELIATSTDVAYSGTVEQESELGLPALPAMGGSDEASTALEFLTGSHSVRVFTDGDDGQRLQVLDRLAERDVVRNGDEVWLYSSRDKEATRLTFPDAASAQQREGVPPTPAAVADRLIESVDPATSVEVGENARVAGRAVYEITLTPDSDVTLVDSVSLSVDAETGLPLQVQVNARGQGDPAFSVGFTEIEFSAPDAALFDFTPPADAEVTEKAIEAPARDGAESAPSDGVERPRPAVVGEGWETVAVLPAGTIDGLDGEQSAMLDNVTTAVDGGRSIETALVSVLLTDDGRVLAGAGPVSALQAAAAL